MRQLYLEAPGRLRLRQAPTPTPDAGELVVEVKGATTCGTDLKTFRRGHPKFPMPTPFGHEFAGVVCAVGAGLEGLWKVGDEVMTAPTAPCGECALCRRGLQNLCSTCMERLILGAFAEKVKVPAHIVAQNLYPKPPELDFFHAALMEPLACAVYGQQCIPSLEDRVVAVIGAGPIGLLHQMLAQRQHPARLLMFGRRKARLDLARAIGADTVFDTETEPDLARALKEATGGRGADVVIECTGQPQVWRDSVLGTASRGTALLFGGCAGGTQVPLPVDQIWKRSLTVLGVFHFTPTAVAEARRLLLTEELPVAHLLSDIRPMSDYQQIFEDLQLGRAVKYGIMPWC